MISAKTPKFALKSTWLEASNPHIWTRIITLGTPKGIAALSEFIRGSGAFTFTGEKYTPRDLPTFFEEPEPPDTDSEEDNSDAEQ